MTAPKTAAPKTVTRKRTAAALAVIATVAVTAACGTAVPAGQPPGAASRPAGQHAGPAAGQARAASSPAATLTEQGSSLLYPLIRTWAARYHQRFPGVTVSTRSTSSGQGIAAASAGAVAIGASDAYLSSGDVVRSPRLRNIPLAVSAQTVIYNLPGIASGVQLNGTILAKIYTGQITMWNDQAIRALNGGVPLPAIPIRPVRRSDSSGDTFLFTSYLSTQDHTWFNQTGYGTTVAWQPVAGELTARGSTAVLNTCAATRGCVAYNGITYLSQAVGKGLGEAALGNSSGRYTLPSGSALLAAVRGFVPLMPPNETMSMIDGPAVTGYPIVNYEYAVVSTRQRDAATASALRAFLTWVVTTGNQAAYLGGYGLQPLPADVVTLARQQIAEIRA